MNPKRRREQGPSAFPLPAVYRQLDDPRPGETETPYDVTAGLEQLMAG